MLKLIVKDTNEHLATLNVEDEHLKLTANYAKRAIYILALDTGVSYRLLIQNVSPPMTKEHRYLWALLTRIASLDSLLSNANFNGEQKKNLRQELNTLKSTYRSQVAVFRNQNTLNNSGKTDK